MRVVEQFIKWNEPGPAEEVKKEIWAKVLGTTEEQAH
jgi:hypothetical protein